MYIDAYIYVYIYIYVGEDISSFEYRWSMEERDTYKK